jgi:hypothetical protein
MTLTGWMSTEKWGHLHLSTVGRGWKLECAAWGQVQVSPFLQECAAWGTGAGVPIFYGADVPIFLVSAIFYNEVCDSLPS